MATYLADLASPTHPRLLAGSARLRFPSLFGRLDLDEPVYWVTKRLRIRGFRMQPDETGKPVSTFMWMARPARLRRLDFDWKRRRQRGARIPQKEANFSGVVTPV